jgi:hypothetical protein
MSYFNYECSCGWKGDERSVIQCFQGDHNYTLTEFQCPKCYQKLDEFYEPYYVEKDEEEDQ